MLNNRRSQHNLNATHLNITSLVRYIFVVLLYIYNIILYWIRIKLVYNVGFAVILLLTFGVWLY